MAEGIAGWSPYSTAVQGGLKQGQFISGQFVLICAGPPYYNQVGFPDGEGTDPDLAKTLVYPIGMVQNWSFSMNQAFSRIFEIGSARSYFISGRAVGQVSMGRVLYHGNNLLRCLYAYYDTRADADVDAFQVRPLMESGGVGINPYERGAPGGVSPSLHSVRIPPGYDNYFGNLASDLFSQPIGLLFLLKDNEQNNYASFYLENCVVPAYGFGVDSQGLIIQESVSVQFERMQPIQLTQLTLIDHFLTPDESGGYSQGRLI